MTAREWKRCETVWCRLRGMKLITDRADCSRCTRSLFVIGPFGGVA